MDKIKFLKIRDVKSPTRAFKFDAGIDFFIPRFNKSFIEDLKEKNPLVFESRVNNSGWVDSTGILSGSSSGTLVMQSETKVDYDLSDDNDTLIKFDENKGENYFLLPPHSRIMIPSGIKSRMFKSGRALIAGNKSGVATKHGLVFGAQVVDYTYKGEIHLSVINTSTKNVRLYENMKIIQFIETPVFNSNIEITDDTIRQVNSTIEKDFYDGLEDDRQSGGFGSTNKN